MGEGNPDDAETFYSVLKETFDPSRIQHGYAQILSHHGQLERALSLLDEIGTGDEDIDSVTLVYLFYDLKARGNIEDTIRVLQAIIDRFPDVYHPYCHLATMFERQGKLDRARGLCEKAIELNPDFTEAKQILERLNK
jgi:tetratricopeptide (TPR) repeat protein